MARAECGFEGRPDELVQYGPTIVVRIGFSPEVSFDRGDRASLPSTQFFALVDTGRRRAASTRRLLWNWVCRLSTGRW